MNKWKLEKIASLCTEKLTFIQIQNLERSELQAEKYYFKENIYKIVFQ